MIANVMTSEALAKEIHKLLINEKLRAKLIEALDNECVDNVEELGKLYSYMED